MGGVNNKWKWIAKKKSSTCHLWLMEGMKNTWGVPTVSDWGRTLSLHDLAVMDPFLKTWPYFFEWFSGATAQMDNLSDSFVDLWNWLSDGGGDDRPVHVSVSHLCNWEECLLYLLTYLPWTLNSYVAVLIQFFFICALNVSENWTMQVNQNLSLFLKPEQQLRLSNVDPQCPWNRGVVQHV